MAKLFLSYSDHSEVIQIDKVSAAVFLGRNTPGVKQYQVTDNDNHLIVGHKLSGLPKLEPNWGARRLRSILYGCGEKWEESHRNHKKADWLQLA